MKTDYYVSMGCQKVYLGTGCVPLNFFIQLKYLYSIFKLNQHQRFDFFDHPHIICVYYVRYVADDFILYVWIVAKKYTTGDLWIQWLRIELHVE